MITTKTNTWSDCKVYKIKEGATYNKYSDEGLELIRIESKAGKVIWELEEESNV